MTREEAREVLRANYPDACYSQLREAVDMAIKALGQEPCEDAISRKAVLDKIKEVCFSREQEWVDFRVSQGSNGQRDLIINFIEDLPSVTPKQNEVLDKIRAEIVEIWKNEPCAIEGGCLDEILQIIDKHTSGKESE